MFIGLLGSFVILSKQTHVTTASQRGFTVSLIDNPNSYEVELPGDRVYINTIDPISEVQVEELIHEQELETFEYVKIINSCNYHYEGICVKIRKGPGLHFPYRGVFRNGQILRAGKTIEVDGIVWQEIVFNEWFRYPNRVRDEWWVSSHYTEKFESTGWELLEEKEEVENELQLSETGKKIVVDKTNQKLIAYEYENIVFEQDVSTGLVGSATPTGTYHIRIKTPSRYMQGPIEVPEGIDTDDPFLDWTTLENYYDLPGVPWNLYFSDDGLVIHGAYWHNNFGERWSHGCVNVPIDAMKEIYEWAELGTIVEITE